MYFSVSTWHHYIIIISPAGKSELRNNKLHEVKIAGPLEANTMSDKM